MSSLDTDQLRATRSFPADVASAEAARRFVESVLHRWGCDGFRDDALLLVSELVTNAVVHARSGCEVVVVHESLGVRVEVSDQDRHHDPVQQPLDLVSPHGRGLLIVDRVATAWGTVHEDGGKRVWFQLHAS
ncbi:ATP-binding protein [Actinomarinicola tropica]|uniref:ATP-binding protein n=1 Tax=Actinomarinicola tropica TaxID=2789776 RepID=UPI001899716D|nr:ATP-binding protein [Actinomarinicola tropica]